MEEKLIFETADGETLALTIVGETTLNGRQYLLAEQDDMAYILKNTAADDEMAFYEVAEDEEAVIVAKVFEEMMDDIEIEL
ncbi:MAG: DUF1292 domain-containing protein [Eubacteriales bacterium]|nr:DUF1292 domain-containing protein [Eubacteriales bacterium]